MTEYKIKFMYGGETHNARVVPMERPIGNGTQGGRITMFYWVHFDTEDQVIFNALQTPMINLKYGINGWEEWQGSTASSEIIQAIGVEIDARTIN